MTEEEELKRFSASFDFILSWVGDGFDDDYVDPGRRSRFGLVQWSHPDVDVRALSKERAKVIYYREKWQPLGCGKLKPPWDLLVFNFAQEPGMEWVGTALQKSVQAKVDGWIGRKTIDAVNASGAGEIGKFLGLAEEHYRDRPNYVNGRPYGAIHRKFWLNRVAEVRNEAVKITEPNGDAEEVVLT